MSLPLQWTIMDYVVKGKLRFDLRDPCTGAICTDDAAPQWRPAMDLTGGLQAGAERTSVRIHG